MAEGSSGDRPSRHEASPTDMVVVRPATRSDLAAVARLPATYPHLARYGLDAAGLERALAAALASRDHVVLAERSGSALGLAWWQPLGAFGRSPYLRLLVVSPTATGAGVGARLMDAVEATALAGASDLFLLVSADNAPAQRFYERRGYVALGTVRDYVVPGVDEVVMRLRRPGGRH